MKFLSLRCTVQLMGTAAILSACGGGSDAPGGPAGAASVAAQAGNNQVGAVGAVLTDSMAVIVRDASNNPVSGVSVSFAAATGGGSVSPATRSTDASGIARSARTLGTGAGAQTATATVAGLPVVTFTAVGQVQGAVNLASATAGTPTDTTLGSSTLVVTATNQNGAPVQGVSVAWAATGGGQVSAPTVATNAAGQSSITYTYGGTAGAFGATATVAGLVGSPVAFTLTGTAGNPTQLVKTTGDNTTLAPASQVTYVVTVRDARNNPKSGVTINWAVTGGGGSITPASNTTAANGTASANRTLGASLGAQTATATGPGIGAGTAVTFTTTAAAVTDIVVSDNNFNPSTTTVPAGTQITWNWNGITSAHNLTFNPAAGVPANEPNRTTGSVQRTFNTAGTFGYQCTNHPGMSGSITVTP